MASNPASSRSSGAAESPLSTTIRRSLGTPLRVQTYKNLLYLALAFPLGLVYFVGLVFGVALGIGLLITWIGLPILPMTLFAATAVAGLEAVLARYLGGANASIPTFLAEFDISGGLVFSGNGFVDAVTRLVTARTTWTSVIIVLVKFGVGLLSLVALTVSGAVTGAFLAARFIYDDPDVILGVGGVVVDGEYTVGSWVVDTFPQALVGAVVGVVFLFVALTLLISLAGFQARFTAKLLQADDEVMFTPTGELTRFLAWGPLVGGLLLTVGWRRSLVETFTAPRRQGQVSSRMATNRGAHSRRTTTMTPGSTSRSTPSAAHRVSHGKMPRSFTITS
jgi:putative effector of murein hydrolase LrgA (UPF0299 family)